MNNTYKIIIGAIVAIVIVWIGVSLFSNTGTQEPAPGEIKGVTKKVEKKDPIKIGVSAPITGEAASYGEAVQAGVELAAYEINEAGGINGVPVELIIEDDTCTSKGVNAMNKLVNIDKVVAVVGPLCSAAAGPSVPIAQRAETPTIIWGSAPDLTSAGDYIFRNYPSDAFQGKFAAEYIFNKLGKRKAAVVYVKNDWGQGISDVFNKTFKNLGGEIVFNESVLQETTDLRTSLSKAKAADPDILYFPVYPQNAVAGLKQIKEIDLDVTIFGGDALSEESITSIPESNDVIFTIGKANNPEEFQRKAKEISGKNPNLFTPYAYDAVMLLAEVIKTTGTDNEAIKDALNNLVYNESVSIPTVEFDDIGDLKAAEFEVSVIKNGEILEYKQ